MDIAPRNPDFAADARASFALQGIMETFRAEMIEIGPGRCILAAPIRPEVSQQQGFAHAALAFALGDSAGGYAALSLQEKGVDVLTSEMKIHLLAPAQGTRLVAEGSVLKPGRRLVIVRSDVFAETVGGRSLIATLLGTIVPVAPRG